MSQFTEWSKNLLIDLDVKTQTKPVVQNVVNEVDPLIDFEKQLQSMVDFAFKKKVTSDKQEINNFNKIHRDLNIKNITKKINSYDNGKKSKNEKYKTYSQSLQSEVAAVDANDNLDAQLDTLLCKKLDLNIDETVATPAVLLKLSEQEIVAKQRHDAYLEKILQLRALINTHDAEKVTKNPEYVSFETACIDNEIGASTEKTFCITDKADIVTPYFK